MAKLTVTAKAFVKYKITVDISDKDYNDYVNGKIDKFDLIDDLYKLQIYEAEDKKLKDAGISNISHEGYPDDGITIEE